MVNDGGGTAKRGRKLTPLDPTKGPLEAFAHELRLLWVRAGELAFEAMASSVGASTSTFTQAVRGTVMPSVATVRSFAVACGCDEAEIRHLLELREAYRRTKATGEAVKLPPPPQRRGPGARGPACQGRRLGGT